MAHKTLVGGTAYDITGGKTLVEGTSYSVKNGKALIGGASYDISFGTTIGDLGVGESVFLNVDGVSTEFIIVHQGLPSSLYDSSCNGTWLLMKTVYTWMIWDPTNNDYANSDIYAYLNNTFLYLLDSDIRAAIQRIKIPYWNGTKSSGTIATGSNGLSTRIFLLSGYELGWTTSNSPYFPVDGAKLSYFMSGTANTANAKRVAKDQSGSTDTWGLRSPHSGTKDIWAVDRTGAYTVPECAISTAVRPALVLSSDFDVTNYLA